MDERQWQPLDAALVLGHARVQQLRLLYLTTHAGALLYILYYVCAPIYYIIVYIAAPIAAVLEFTGCLSAECVVLCACSGH